MPTILNLMADGCDADDRPEACADSTALLAGLYTANVEIRHPAARDHRQRHPQGHLGRRLVRRRSRCGRDLFQSRASTAPPDRGRQRLGRADQPAPAAVPPCRQRRHRHAGREARSAGRSRRAVRHEHLPESTFRSSAALPRCAICVHVQGLPAEYGDIAKRIIEIAAQVHAPVAAATDCKPNVHVIFHHRAPGAGRRPGEAQDILLGFCWNALNLKKLAAFNQQISPGTSRTRPVRRPARNPRSGGSPQSPGRPGRSRLSNGMSTEVVHSLIVADANRSPAKIDAVADIAVPGLGAGGRGPAVPGPYRPSST